MGLIVETVRVYRDERGLIFEPIATGELARFSSIHVAVSEPNSVRGNHYHSRSTVVMVAVGPCLLRFRQDAGIRDVAVRTGEAARFEIPPGVSHAIHNTGLAPGVVVVLRSGPETVGVDDLVREVLIPSDA
jgi:dTDP-4-dehydrorhamnose 3,5-epimerase-like enzyme